MDVNSHEVQRRLEGVCEKLQIANYGGYAKTFRDIVDRFVSHPICTSHAEHAVQWSVLEFMLDVAHNPVAGLKKRLLDNAAGAELFQEFASTSVELPSPSDQIEVMPVAKDPNPSEFEYYNDESELSVSSLNFWVLFTKPFCRIGQTLNLNRRKKEPRRLT